MSIYIGLLCVMLWNTYCVPLCLRVADSPLFVVLPGFSVAAFPLSVDGLMTSLWLPGKDTL